MRMHAIDGQLHIIVYNLTHAVFCLFGLQACHFVLVEMCIFDLKFCINTIS